MEKTARDHIIVEGFGKFGTAGGIGHDREKWFVCARCKRSVEFASNGALPRPTVDENGVLGAMPGCDIVERIIVDPATANDADRIVEGLPAKPGQRIFEQDPDGRACAGKREDHKAPRRLRPPLDSTDKDRKRDV